ncbi:MAG: FTR1 family iron permease [Spirochaetaceae bacterium]|jgi:high-affinity iron transporter|nr:FTR1 family iron permease [Spirochaetaceae bacterium]
MSKKRSWSLLPILLIIAAASPVFADAGYWEGVERELRLILTESYYRYVSGDTEGAQALVDTYFAGYKTSGFEAQVLALISPARAQNIEEWVNYVKTSMKEDISQQEIREIHNELLHLMRVTANRLDGKEEPVAAARNWTATANEMAAVLENANARYLSGDEKGAKDQVDVVYFQFYEKVGFERITLSRISGARAAQVEYQFSAIKKAITNRAPEVEVTAALDTLATRLREDAAQLDGREESALVVFLESLLIIVREGFEAILVVGAIVAYLLKSGNKKRTPPVYWGSVIALGVSVIMAWILGRITSVAGGQNQEIIEGATMLLAVVVLFYVSNWMVSKAEAEAWSGYIESKVQSSITRGSMFSLAFAAFLAVFREGAETILFYQALLANTETYINMVWLGLGVGAVALVIIYILIRVLSIRIPLKPFFLGTSVLLFVMSITFVGNGVKELQEGNVIPVTSISGVASVDILGIYPTLETLIPQVLLLGITVATFIIQLKRGKAKAAAAKGAA